MVDEINLRFPMPRFCWSVQRPILGNLPEVLPLMFTGASGTKRWDALFYVLHNLHNYNILEKHTRWVPTSYLRMHLPHCVEFWKSLPWLMFLVKKIYLIWHFLLLLSIISTFRGILFYLCSASSVIWFLVYFESSDYMCNSNH